MAVAFDAKCTTHFSTNTSASPTDVTTLTVGSGSNRALLVGIMVGTADLGVTSIVWDPGGAAQTLTLITGAQNVTTRHVAWFGLVNPIAGNKTLRLTFTSLGANLLCEAASFTGVDQSGGVTTFYGGTAGFTAAAANSSVTVSSATGDMCVAAHLNGTAGFTGTSGTTLFTDQSLGAINGAANYAAGAASVTLTGTWPTGTDTVYWAGAAIKAAASGTTAQGSARYSGAGALLSAGNVLSVGLVVGTNVLDSGLAWLDSNADKIYVCSAQPTTYTEATSTLALGSKNLGVGNVFGAPAAGSPNGRKVTSVAVTDGAVTANGTVNSWAVVDSINTTLLASGSLSGARAVTSGQVWTLDPIIVHLPSQ